MAAIDQNEGALQSRTAPQEVTRRFVPARNLCLRRHRMAVAGQVNNPNTLDLVFTSDGKENEFACTPRFGGRPRQPFATNQSIHKAGLADIRTPSKADFWRTHRGQIGHGLGRPEETRLETKQPLSWREVTHWNHRFRHDQAVFFLPSLAKNSSIGFEVPDRFAITYCCTIVSRLDHV